MTVPLRGRLAQIIREAWHRSRAWAPGVQLPVEEFADALIASEEWHAREAVVTAASAFFPDGFAMREQDRLEIGMRFYEALAVALARLDAVRGEETNNGG